MWVDILFYACFDVRLLFYFMKDVDWESQLLREDPKS